MALSFGVGIMNLAWMIFLTLILCVEKMAPGGRAISRVFGILLIGLGLFRILFAAR
jgi:predicted metal-binding membrane protein